MQEHTKCLKSFHHRQDSNTIQIKVLVFNTTLRNRDADFEKPRLGSFQVDLGSATYPNTIIKPYRGIPPGESKTVYFKPLAGIFNQHKFIPLRYCPIQIEFEVVNCMNDPIMYSTNGPGAVGRFRANALSNQWLISNIQFKCDLVTLD